MFNLTHETTNERIHEMLVADLKEILLHHEWAATKSDFNGMGKIVLRVEVRKLRDWMIEEEEKTKEAKKVAHDEAVAKDSENSDYLATKDALLRMAESVLLSAKDVLQKYRSSIGEENSNVSHEIYWNTEKIHRATGKVREFTSLRAFLEREAKTPTLTMDEVMKELQRLFEEGVERLVDVNVWNMTDQDKGNFEAKQYLVKILRRVMRAAYRDMEEFGNRISFVSLY